ncbi:MAG TPA: polyphosphate:AMP phosphotransferase [Casimicrobiaceae bacterium]|nr:polyphosphate:AMP phosphotransferase [Casimicrobiaceae bacterium]
MLEAAEVGHRLGKARYAREARRLREELLLAQFDLARKGRGPVVVVVSGVEGAGRHETANQLTSWMDPRHIRVSAFGAPTADEGEHPIAWRYWNALPPRGAMGVFMSAWYHEPLAGRSAGALGDRAYDDELQRLRQHETMLSAEAVVLVKFWMHLSKPALKARIRAIEADPDESWRLTGDEKHELKDYARRREDWEHMLRTTSITVAPWYVIEGVDRRYREISVATLLLAALRKATAERPARVAPQGAPPAPAALGNVEIIRKLDLTLRLPKKRYDDELSHWQRELARLTRHKRFRRHALVLAFEGSDAAGKGGAIRRVTGALDARQYVTVPIAAPSDEERAHPYLWRFWRAVPRLGGITLFDRTWYGRVLVERVERLCRDDEWMRAYDEINQFEQELTECDVVVCKFWLQISRDEQLRRFRAREKTPFKRFKITPDDWRNRKRWADYEQAAADMVERTSTDLVPWTLVEAEDKHYARVKVVRTIAERLARALGVH